MGKFCQLSPELWPLIDVILCSYIELIFHGGVSCLLAALLFIFLSLTPICNEYGNFRQRFLRNYLI